MSLIVLEDARARGLNLPADDDVAQDIIDEREAWLARKLGGPLTGDRTETFYVGWSTTHGKLSLARYTDEVAVTDGSLTGGATVDPDDYRLVDNGSAIHRVANLSTIWWLGPYVTATYEPNDLLEVQSVLYDLIALKLEPVNGYQSEQIGAYSYQRVPVGAASNAAQQAALVASLIPKRDPALTVKAVSRYLQAGDPVINRPEPVW